MEIHDFFAAAALIGLIIRNENCPDESAAHQRYIAKLAFEYAEEMVTRKFEILEEEE